MTRMWSHRIFETIKWDKIYKDVNIVPEHIVSILYVNYYHIIIVNINTTTNNTGAKISGNKVEWLLWRNLPRSKTYWDLSFHRGTHERFTAGLNQLLRIEGAKYCKERSRRPRAPERPHVETEEKMELERKEYWTFMFFNLNLQNEGL